MAITRLVRLACIVTLLGSSARAMGPGTPWAAHSMPGVATNIAFALTPAGTRVRQVSLGHPGAKGERRPLIASSPGGNMQLL
jgi:hypothetical protein